MGTKRSISLAIICITFVGISLFLKNNPELFNHIKTISLWWLAPLYLLMSLVLTFNGLTVKVFAAKFGVWLRWREWFGLAAVTAMGNYLAPLGGMTARAAYLKHRYEFPYSHFLAVLAAHYLISFAVISVVGIIAVLSLAGETPWPVLLFFLAALATLALASVLPAMSDRLPFKLPQIVQSARDGFELIRQDKSLWGKTTLLTLGSVAARGVLYFTAFAAVGFAVPFTIALLVCLLTSFTLLVNITPGNLGVREAVVGLAAAVLGAGVESGLLAALVIRAVTILCAFTLGPIFSYLLSRELAITKPWRF